MIEVFELMKELWSELLLGLTGLSAYLYERNKRRSQKVDTGEKIIEMYQNSLDDLRLRFEAKYESQQKDLDMCSLRITELKKELFEMEEEVEKWKNKYLDAKKELEKKLKGK